MAIKVDLVADASKAIKEAGKLGDALEDVADDLKDVGKSGKTIDDKVQDAFRNMGKEAKNAGDKVGKSVKDGTDQAGEGLGELKDEAAGTAREAAASFGSIEDAASALQEVAANAFVGFGPAGMAAGVLAAAGIGLAISAMTDQADKINENKEKMLALAQTIRDNGGALTQGDYVKQMDEYGYAIQDTKEWFEIFQADAVTGWDKIRDAQESTGLSARQVFKGGFGGVDEARETLALVEEKLKGTKERAEALYQLDGSMDPVDSEAITSLEDYKRQVEQNIRAQEQAAEIERERRRSIEGTTEALREDIAALEARTDAIKGGITSELDYLDGVDELTAKLKDNGATVDLNSAKGRDNRRAILDQAEAIEEMAKASIDAGGSVADVTGKFNAQRDALVDQVTPAFGGSKEAARAYIEQILKTPQGVKTDVKLDGVAAAEAAIKSLTDRQRTVSVVVRPDGSEVDRYFMLNSGRKLYVNIAPRGGVGITD